MQRTQRSIIKNVKECKERSILFIKNANNARTFHSFEKNTKERKNVSFFWKERMPNPAYLTFNSIRMH